jgi:hypothetical protein
MIASGRWQIVPVRYLKVWEYHYLCVPTATATLHPRPVELTSVITYENDSCKILIQALMFGCRQSDKTQQSRTPRSHTGAHQPTVNLVIRPAERGDVHHLIAANSAGERA